MLARTGFTVIELLVALALIGVIASLGLWWSTSLNRSGTLIEETDRLARALIRARTGALTEGISYGVCKEDGNAYRLYGGEFTESFKVSATITVTGLPLCEAGIEFTALSATTTPAVIRLTEDGREQVIEVNGQGRIAR